MQSLVLTPQQKATVHRRLEIAFPNLTLEGFEVRSQPTPVYNCVAYAADIYTIPWWPSDPHVTHRDYYWPDDIPREETIESFILAFGTIGYEPCENGDYEEGYEKVAIYVDERRRPKHMAKQLIADRTWSSKLGDAWDIHHHTLESIEGDQYGRVAQFLRRHAG